MKAKNEAPFDSRSKNERMAARAEARQKRKRRAQLRVGALALFLILAAALVFAVFYFKVKTVTVKNDAIRYSDEAIISAADIENETSLLTLNKRAVANRIKKTLPYIGSVRVRRRIPDTVSLEVEYTRATLAVERSDGCVLLNNDGKVLQTGVQKLSDYTALVYGVEITSAVPGEKVVLAEPDKLLYVTGLATAFEAHGYNNVTAYDLSDLSDVIVEVNYNTDLKLGGITKAESRLRFGKEVIARTLSGTRASSSKLVVDLTTDGTAYVRTQSAIDQAREAAARAKYRASLPEETTAAVIDGETLPDEPTRVEEPDEPEDETDAPAGEEPAGEETDGGTDDGE